MSLFEIDLHGYTVSEAIELFIENYNRRVGAGKLSSFSVVHGYGSTGSGGRIRTALLKILQANEGCLSFQRDERNHGRTIVHPEKRLPEGAGIISGEILAYCSEGKTESKILGKFRRYGDLNVRRTLQDLLKNRRMNMTLKGRHKVYTAI